MRIALGVLGHEANTFSPHLTTWEDFATRWLRRGADVLQGLEGLNIEEAGALEVFSSAGCTVLPTFAARALSGGPVTASAFHRLREELISALRQALPVDGILLVLHGAMMAEDEPDATGAVLEAARELVGPEVPIVGTLDLHANVTARMVAHATALVGYHTAPHIDMGATGQAAARLLLRILRGECAPRMARVRLPLLLPPENARHTEGPLAEVLGLALEMERTGRALHAAVYPVQPWMDTPDTGCATVVITDGAEDAAQALAAELAQALWGRRHAFTPELLPPDEAVARALARPAGTVVLCDSADSTTSGSTGDSTVILQALLRRGTVEETCLLNVVDPPAVAQAIAAGVGAEVTLQVGGKLAPRFFTPVIFNGRVKLLSDGEFSFRGPGMRGVPHHMGRTAVLVQGGIHLVVMERAVSQWDPQLYRSLGLEPREARIVQVKSPAAFRAAYQGIMDEVLLVAAPGAADPRLATLPWQHLPRPIFPLDPEARFEPPRPKGRA